MNDALRLAHELDIVRWSDAQAEAATMLRKQDAAIKQLREALEMSLRVFVNQGWEHDLVAAKKAHTALAATEEFAK